MKTYERIFGSGPLGFTLSLILLIIAVRLERTGRFPPLTSHNTLRYIVFAFTSALTVIIVMWSVRSLPPSERGKALCTSGAFAYFRHPLYAAFLSSFDFGLAFFLNNFIYILWALLLHPLWHRIIAGEEKLMERAFPGEYQQYKAVTGRFFPKLSHLFK